ncbi:unannotated protein [freshwater metagenome]|uniref:Unannotated protein n=1 Tax=freshwater metagenome TaxID=449393 RepID=A0A6J6RL03_9ZZZZ
MVLLSVKRRAIALRIPECGISIKLPVGITGAETADARGDPPLAIAA